MFGSPTDIQVDQSTLKGESLPIEAESGRTAFSGSVVIRGEASGRSNGYRRPHLLWQDGRAITRGHDRESSPGDHFHDRQIPGHADRALVLILLFIPG